MQTVFNVQEKISTGSQNQGSQGGPIVNDEQVLLEASQKVEENIDSIVQRSNAYDSEVHQSMKFIDQRIRESSNTELMSPDEQAFEVIRQQRHDDPQARGRADTLYQPQAAQTSNDAEETPDGGYDFAPQDVRAGEGNPQ